MRNRYPGACRDCGGLVPAGEGYFERAGDRWNTRHVLCVAIAKLERGVRFSDLSHAQQRAMRPFMEDTTMK